MKEVITLARKDLQLLFLDKTSLVVTFVLPAVLIALIGSVFSSMVPADSGITSYDYAFSKVMFWGLIGGAASSVTSLAIEKSSGTIVRLQLSPVKRFQILLGKSLACVLVMLITSVFSWLFATIIFGIKTNSYLFLFLLFISNAVLFTGIMTFLGNFARTERGAGALSWSVLQVLACFSGIMFPVTIMPPWMIAVANFNPITWSVKAMEIVLWKDVTVDALLPMAIPTLSGIAFFMLSLSIFRWSSQQ